MLPIDTAVRPDQNTRGGVDYHGALGLRNEPVWWPVVFSETGINALTGDAMLGVCLRGPTDSLLLASDTGGGTQPDTIIPPLGADRQAQPDFPGKPRIAHGQPALVVKPVSFGISVNNAALNVGEPLVTPHYGGGMGDYKRELYDVLPAAHPQVGSLDASRRAPLEGAIVPRKIVRGKTAAGVEPAAHAAFNYGPGYRSNEYKAAGWGLFTALGHGGSLPSPGAPVTGGKPVTITGGRQRPTFTELQAWMAQGGERLTPEEATINVAFQDWLAKYRKKDPNKQGVASAINLPAIAAGRSDVDYRGRVPLESYMANDAGGPIIPGFKRDKHRLGITGDNVAVNPGTIAVNALYGTGMDGQERFHAPLDFELVDEPEVKPDVGTPIRVHLQYDHELDHIIRTAGINGADTMRRPGMFRWHVRIPIRYPEEPPTYPTMGQPLEPPGFPPLIPPTISPPYGGDGLEGAFLVVTGDIDRTRPMLEKLAVPIVARISGLQEIDAYGRSVPTYEPTLDISRLEAAGTDEVVAMQARERAATADGLLIIHPPELTPQQTIYGAAIPADRRVSDTTLLLHRTTLAWGKAAANQASAVEGWRAVYDPATGGLDFSYYDETGAADTGMDFTVHGSPIGGGGGSGDVVGPASATDGNFPLWDTTTGKLLKDSAYSPASFEVPLTFSTGLTRTTNTITVNTSQNIATLSNLTSNGFVKTGGGVGTLSVSAQVALGSEVSGDLPFANLTQIAGLSVLGVTGSSTADVAAITAGTDGHVLRRSSSSAMAFGTLLAGSFASNTAPLGTIANGTADRLIGRDGGGIINETTVAGPLSLTGGGLTTSMATNKLIGRGTSGTGVMEEITLGAGLALTGTTLNVTSGGGNMTNTGTPTAGEIPFASDTSGTAYAPSGLVYAGGSLYPEADGTEDLGKTSKVFADLYQSGVRYSTVVTGTANPWIEYWPGGVNVDDDFICAPAILEAAGSGDDLYLSTAGPWRFNHVTTPPSTVVVSPLDINGGAWELAITGGSDGETEWFHLGQACIDESEQPGSGYYALEFWVKFASGTAYMRVGLFNGLGAAATDERVCLLYDTDDALGEFRLEVADGSSIVLSADGDLVALDNEWHHCVIVRDGAGTYELTMDSESHFTAIVADFATPVRPAVLWQFDAGPGKVDGTVHLGQMHVVSKPYG